MRWQLPLALLLLSGLLVPPSAAQSSNRWPAERSAGPFRCHADFPLAAAEPLLARMAQLQQDLATVLEIRPTREPIYLFWFQQKTTYQSYLAYYFPQVPDRRALFIKGRGPGMVFAYQNREFEIDVMHESTHALLHASLPMVPLWLDEGLAEYFEVPPQQREVHHPHFTAVKWRAQLGSVPDLEELEKIADLSQMGRSQYRDAWAWVHFMLHSSPETRQELIAFLKAIEAHTPPGKLSERLRRRMPDLEIRFAEHFRHWKPT